LSTCQVPFKYPFWAYFVFSHFRVLDLPRKYMYIQDKGNNKITELRTIFQRESPF
jgi:hypothetical protein